ncbi:CARDB domain-containing protein [Sneathiella aquimaris]|uniref:CARDB domain-containing protein n=1 Tax=Sneathiella aquimaris TaxID=2599305 RepID=UPI00146C12B7|nr:CARDB domain-containing protein [Sneathiella aquimaris]
MKNMLLASVFAVATLATFATTATAANPNGPKPKCPFGQIPVLEMGSYTCKDLTIKAPGRETENQAGSAKFGAVKKPARAKADFVILSATRVGGSDTKFGVQIKNQGTQATSGGLLQGLNMGQGGGGATAYMPKFKAGETKFVFVDFKTSKFERSDRILFMADYKNDVPESKENNNKYAVNY